MAATTSAVEALDCPGFLWCHSVTSIFGLGELIFKEVYFMKTVFKADGGTMVLDRTAIINLMTGSTSVAKLVEERRQVQIAQSMLKARIAEERRK